MKLKSILAITIASLVTLSATVMAAPKGEEAKAAAPKIQLGAFHFINRDKQEAILITNKGPVAMPKEEVPLPSKNLLTEIDGYKVYMDIPAWVAKTHTTSDKERKGAASIFNYRVKTKYEGPQIIVVKNFINDKSLAEVRNSIESSLPAVGSKLANGKVFTQAEKDRMVAESVPTNVLISNLVNIVDANGKDVETVKMYPAKIDGQPAILSSVYVVDKPRVPELTNAINVQFLKGNDLIIGSISYGKNISPEDLKDTLKAVLSTDVK